MIISFIFLVIFCHFIGDFILQSDAVAQGKSKSNAVLARHVAYYALAFAPVFLLDISFQIALAWVAINAAMHFATDFVSSRMTTHFWQSGNRRYFFITIGADQAFHMYALFGTAYLLGIIR